MGIRLIFLSLEEVTDAVTCQSLLDWTGREGVPGNSPSIQTVPETDTGGLAEKAKALERTALKELGKLLPYVRKKGGPSPGNRWWVAQTRGWRLFTKNTGLCEAARRRIGTDACPVPEG